MVGGAPEHHDADSRSTLANGRNRGSRAAQMKKREQGSRNPHAVIYVGSVSRIKGKSRESCGEGKRVSLKLQ